MSACRSCWYIIIYVALLNVHAACMHACTGKINETLDGDLFHSRSRKRRQAPVDENLPYSYGSFNYTTEQIAVCGDDQACLFDYAVTGRKDFAETTLESGNNFTRTVDILSKWHETR